MIKFKQSGNFEHFNSFAEKALEFVNWGRLDEYGRRGVAALAASTPTDTGKTAESWRYEIKRRNGTVSINWYNTNINDGCNIAIILQYGHGTINGGYVQGRDYINATMRPLFDEIAESAWKEVSKSS